LATGRHDNPPHTLPEAFQILVVVGLIVRWLLERLHFLQRPDKWLERAPQWAITRIVVGQAFQPDIQKCQAGKPDLLKDADV